MAAVLGPWRLDRMPNDSHNAELCSVMACFVVDGGVSRMGCRGFATAEEGATGLSCGWKQVASTDEGLKDLFIDEPKAKKARTSPEEEYEEEEDIGDGNDAADEDDDNDSAVDEDEDEDEDGGDDDDFHSWAEYHLGHEYTCSKVRLQARL
ncbi:uncharacterized protein LOC133883831 [Phragmites australis]|uniref:uncharacterized protein LOC133883831 n=1 Tax=Phragmites australis TaxID=29695 RepID=UPI002D770CF2|nr:uncharacterized protein LOC133883831 [Phragmites australis]